MKTEASISNLSKETFDNFIFDLSLGNYFPKKNIKEIPQKTKEEKPKKPT